MRCGCSTAAAGCRHPHPGADVAVPPPLSSPMGGPPTDLWFIISPCFARPRAESLRHLLRGSTFLPLSRPPTAIHQGHRQGGMFVNKPRWLTYRATGVLFLRRGWTAGGTAGGFAAAGRGPPRVCHCLKFSRLLPPHNSARYEGTRGVPRYGVRRVVLGGVPWPHAGNVDVVSNVTGLDTLHLRAQIMWSHISAVKAVTQLRRLGPPPQINAARLDVRDAAMERNCMVTVADSSSHLVVSTAGARVASGRLGNGANASEASCAR